MRTLIVTEKHDAPTDQRDGGARLVETLRRSLGEACDVLQFGGGAPHAVAYPNQGKDRFHRRMANASFIAQRVADVAHKYTHVCFVHVSMQFGFARVPLEGPRAWTFPMFLTPSYLASGERVPSAYTRLERAVLAKTSNVLTPSYLERRQLEHEYGVAAERIRVVPRGIDLARLPHRVRTPGERLVIASVGSIKPQKGTLELVDLFSAVRRAYPGARLELVGPAQDGDYLRQVEARIESFGLADAVTHHGFVSPNRLGDVLERADLHLSTSNCETFGRAIVETAAMGIPGLARRGNNAAAEFLAGCDGVRFFDTEHEALEGLADLLGDYERASRSGAELRELFDDQSLGHLLAAEIEERETAAICDYDGTLFHKSDADRTSRCMAEFARFPLRVVCSARPIPELVAGLARHGQRADYLIGWSGAVLADGTGRTLTAWPMDEPHRQAFPDASPVRDASGRLIQLEFRTPPGWLDSALRAESYPGHHVVLSARASKLRAALHLLRSVGWTGRVRAFGDGPNDEQMLTWFDGTWVHPTRESARWLRRGEVSGAC